MLVCYAIGKLLDTLLHFAMSSSLGLQSDQQTLNINDRASLTVTYSYNFALSTHFMVRSFGGLLFSPEYLRLLKK